MDDSESNCDLDLLDSLFELAEKKENEAPETESSKSNFGSILESLDEIPVKVPSKGQSSMEGKEKSASSEEKSVVHSGDTDSEDDEDKKYFHKKQYNDYGSTIKNMLESEEKSSSYGFQGSSSGCSKSWKSTPKVAPGTLCMPASEVKKPVTDLNFDTLVGVRVVNPIVSSVVLYERLNSRRVVPFSDMKNFTSNGKIREDWVVVGVIVSKSPPRTSAKGSTYVIIKLSDLKGLGDMKTVSVFLFSTACKVHGKNSVGTVLGILNPGVLDNSKGHGDEACLSVDGADRIMVLGVSRDFGICKSKKKNGENCTAFVNRANCEHCIYHVKQEYSQFSRRTELQASFTGKGLTGGINALRNKVLGKNEIFYGGQSFTAIPAKRSIKMMARDNQRLAVLSGTASATPKQQDPSKRRIATSLDLSHRQTQKDRDRLRKLGALDTNSSADQRPAISASAENFSPKLKAEETRNDTLAFISKAREAAASKSTPGSCQPPNVDSNSVATGPSLSERCSTPVTPKTPTQLSRGAAFALAATQKISSSPKGQPSAFGLGMKSSPVAESVSNAASTKKSHISSDSERVQAIKKVSSLVDYDVAVQKSAGELKILSKLIEKRATKLATPKVAQDEPTTPVITKASDFGLGRRSRPQSKAGTPKATQDEPTTSVIPKASDLGLGRQTPLQSKPELNRATPTVAKSAPTLSAGSSNSGVIEFDVFDSSKSLQSPKPVSHLSPSVLPLGKTEFDLSVNQKNHKSAKLKALELIRRTGSIAKEDPNKLELSNKKKAASGNEPRKRKIEEVLETSVSSKKKVKNQEEEEAHKKMMAEFKALMEVSSKHANLVTKADNEAQEEYFKNLEKKEQLEEKMLNTYKVACKAVTCSRCKYTAFSAADICKEERHPLKVHDATKRFFKCGDCGNRTCCLGIIPLKTCKNCNGAKWERTAMIREKKVGIGSETLSVRGGEEKFIGSVVTGANLNLLVPD